MCVLYTQIGSCVCHVDKISQFPRFLSLLHRKKRNPANLFTFPKCQDKLGGLHVSAQSSRRLLFYKKSGRGGLFLFASSSYARRDGGPHLPGRVGLASLPRGGRAASSPENVWPDRPTLRDPQREGRLGAGAAAWLGVRWRVWAWGSGLGAGRTRIPAVSAGRGEGRGEVSIQECASELFLFFFFTPL